MLKILLISTEEGDLDRARDLIFESMVTVFTRPVGKPWLDFDIDKAIVSAAAALRPILGDSCDVSDTAGFIKALSPMAQR